jgi:hypothetical protein
MTDRKVAGSSPDEVDFLIYLIIMSTRKLPGGRGKGWPALKTDNLTAIYEPIV